MRIKKEEEVTTTRKVVDKIICDWCGSDDIDPKKREFWDEEFFDISYEVFSPDDEHERIGGWEVEDLCNICIERLRIYLVEQGVKIKVHNDASSG